jgi:imidazole glycerol-phosphate synthase subunit HisF
MIRIIPRLDIKGADLVKGIHLEGLRVLGSPELFAQYYYENGADEIFFQDVVASLFERNSLHEIISRTAQNIFIPITVGGGIRNLDDIGTVLRAGADKVSLNTAVIRNPKLIEEAALFYGSSTIVVSIEVIKQNDGRHLAFIDNGREHTGIEVLEWIKQIQNLGAGEIVLTSVDREGTGEGFDIELLEKVSAEISVPLVIHGGASSLLNIKEAINKGADALALASMLHYKAISELKQYTSFNEEEGNRSFLMSKGKRQIYTSTIHEIKDFLNSSQISIRKFL